MKSTHLFLCVTIALASIFAGCQRDQARADAKKIAGDVKVVAQKAAAKAGDELADGWLTTKIQSQFFADADVRARDINVTTRDGIVTLRGSVDNPNAHEQAVQIAKNTDGVKEVIDQLGVGLDGPKPAPSGAVATAGAVVADGADHAAGYLDDARITSSIQSKYFLDDTVKGRHINVDTQNGVVTLRGEVGSEAERSEALLLARTAEGVKRVEDSLVVLVEQPATTEAAAPPPVVQKIDDAVLTTKIQSKFFLDGQVKAGSIDVMTKDGVVLLEGSVPSTAAKERAIALARETDGVTQVVDRIRVAKRTK